MGLTFASKWLLKTAIAANEKPDAKPIKKPKVLASAKSRLGVMSIKPAVTITVRIQSVRVTRLGVTRASMMVIKAAKLLKPSVANATPAVLTDTKNVTQWIASISPDPKQRIQSWVSDKGLATRWFGSLGWSRKNHKMGESTTAANIARPNVITSLSASIRVLRIPVMPNRKAARWIERMLRFNVLL